MNALEQHSQHAIDDKRFNQVEDEDRDVVWMNDREEAAEKSGEKVRTGNTFSKINVYFSS